MLILDSKRRRIVAPTVIYVAHKGTRYGLEKYNSDRKSKALSRRNRGPASSSVNKRCKSASERTSNQLLRCSHRDSHLFHLCLTCERRRHPDRHVGAKAPVPRSGPERARPVVAADYSTLSRRLENRECLPGSTGPVSSTRRRSSRYSTDHPAMVPSARGKGKRRPSPERGRA